MAQVNEIINIILAALGLLLIFTVLLPNKVKRHYLFYTAYLFLLGGLTFTIVEGYVWKELFNTLEHLCYAFTGLLFLFGCLRLRKWTEKEEEVK